MYFRGTFRGCEYSIWATIHRKVPRKCTPDLLFRFPKFSFGAHKITPTVLVCTKNMASNVRHRKACIGLYTKRSGLYCTKDHRIGKHASVGNQTFWFVQTTIASERIRRLVTKRYCLSKPGGRKSCAFWIRPSILRKGSQRFNLNEWLETRVIFAQWRVVSKTHTTCDHLVRTNQIASDARHATRPPRIVAYGRAFLGRMGLFRQVDGGCDAMRRLDTTRWYRPCYVAHPVQSHPPIVQDPTIRVASIFI